MFIFIHFLRSDSAGFFLVNMEGPILNAERVVSPCFSSSSQVDLDSFCYDAWVQRWCEAGSLLITYTITLDHTRTQSLLVKLVNETGDDGQNAVLSHWSLGSQCANRQAWRLCLQTLAWSQGLLGPLMLDFTHLELTCSSFILCKTKGNESSPLTDKQTQSRGSV